MGHSTVTSPSIYLTPKTRACRADVACIKEQQLAAIQKLQSLGAPIARSDTKSASQRGANDGSRPPGSQVAPPKQRAAGEFARLVAIPSDCQAARELLQTAPGGAIVLGPACPAVVSCGQAIYRQVAATTDYLKRNSIVSDALRNQLGDPRLWRYIFERMSDVLQRHEALPTTTRVDCVFQLAEIESQWGLSLTSRKSLTPPRVHPFEAFSEAGKALLNKTRADYKADEAEFQQLVAFNDRYAGVERLEREQAAYHKAFEADDLAGMMSERPAFLKELEGAKARKQLLLQQTAQLIHYEQTLSDFAASVDRDGLTKFAGQQTLTPLGELQTKLQSLGQTAPAKRGDIAADLAVFETRVRDIDIGIRTARSMKSQAEHTRQMLVENEDMAENALNAAANEELRGALDERVHRHRQRAN
jgi:hypothetical protein